MKWMVIAGLLLGVYSSKALDQSEVINGWLSRQTNVQTWTANFTQTRNLKSLAQPLVSTGQVWFAAPYNFRWELANNQTVAIRNGDTMLVVYPRLKRAERYDFDRAANNQWKDTIALLQTGFPQSEKELRAQFSIISLQKTAEQYRLELEPRSPSARKMMPRIHVFLDAEDFTLAGTELVFVDESRMRNDFYNIRTNLDISGKFSYTLPPGFKLVQPLKER